MAVIIAPGIARFTINGTFGGRPVANILDVNISDLVNGGRGEACERVAGDILNNWNDHILPLVVDDYVATSVSWIDIDSLTGSTGVTSSTDGSTWPLAGGNTDAAASSNVAIKVTKETTAVRGQRQGSMFICGMSETNTASGSPNELLPVVVDVFNDALEEFRSGLEGAEAATGGGVAYTSSPNVVHTVDGVYTGKSRITRLSVQSRLATQRRRLRG